MKYTIRDGVVHPFSVRFSDNTRFILPLLVIAAGVLFFMLGPRPGSHRQHPLTLGIYNIRTPDSSSGSASSSGSSSSGGSADGSGAATLSGQSPVATAGPVDLGTGSSTASTLTSPAVSPVTTGGMGGGAVAPPPAPTTVSCVDQLTQTATLCVFPYQTCTIPLSGITGYKTVDGTCITIN